MSRRRGHLVRRALPAAPLELPVSASVTPSESAAWQSLLEQQRPNVFQMNVANILPGDIINVELKYTELLVPEEGVYEFVYPTVVGPRYVGPAIATDRRSSTSSWWTTGVRAC